LLIKAQREPLAALFNNEEKRDAFAARRTLHNTMFHLTLSAAANPNFIFIWEQQAADETPQA